jgi:hypothetical protein
VIYRNKYTTAVGFDTSTSSVHRFAQPTDRSRVERSRNSPTQVFSLPEITLVEEKQGAGGKSRVFQKINDPKPFIALAKRSVA